MSKKLEIIFFYLAHLIYSSYNQSANPAEFYSNDRSI